MTIFVFVGPTLSLRDARAELDAVFLPPVAQGDVYRATLERPQAIGIIDGYFERVPAVWHKEILWAMTQGIHVFGSASMGALRAAELSAFGMEGIGAIYEAFARGELEDDDEVAVAHATGDDGFRQTSEPMVNIRFTFTAAEEQGIVSRQVCRALIDIAKQMFYAERSYRAVFAKGHAQGLPLEPLEAWLPRGRIDQKRLDALAMLRHMRQWLSRGVGAKRTLYSFEHTDTWEEVRRGAGRLALGADGSASSTGASHEALVEELRAQGRLASVRDGAIARALALEEAHRIGRRSSTDLGEATAGEFRRTHGLLEDADFTAWLAKNELTRADFDRFMADEALVRGVEGLLESDIARTLRDHLIARNDYATLLDRVRTKRP